MNLHHLKIFYYVAKHNSLTKAAKELELTQPAVSLQLNKFQKKYNFKLFDIKVKKVHLTALGKEIFEYCKTIFDIEKKIETVISDYQKSKAGLISIFATDLFTISYLPAIISEFTKKLPNIIPQTFTYPSAVIAEETVNLINDIGFTGYKIEHPKLVIKELLSESLHLVCHPDHPLSKKRVIMPHDLETHNFITHEKTAGMRRAIDKYAKDHNIKLNIVAEYDFSFLIMEMLKQNLGISILSKNVIAEAIKKKEVICIPLSEGCFRSFYLVYSKEKYLSDTVKAFINETEIWCNNYNAKKIKELTKPG
ncbi:MAG: LysR family transcriptional regulator [Spirochaetaceae bacterium]|nr:LysR family transcriptional regulator [Spirochaetaceae bacterium]